MRNSGHMSNTDVTDTETTEDKNSKSLYATKGKLISTKQIHTGGKLIKNIASNAHINKTIVYN